MVSSSVTLALSSVKKNVKKKSNCKKKRVILCGKLVSYSSAELCKILSSDVRAGGAALANTLGSLLHREHISKRTRSVIREHTRQHSRLFTTQRTH